MPKFGQILIVLILRTYFCKCDNLGLDISPDSKDNGSRSIIKSTYHIDGLACRKFSPKAYNRIVKVADGTHIVWQGGDAECTGAIMYPETGSGKLLHLFITKSDGTSHEYYYREGDTWKSIGSVAYRKRLDEFTPKQDPVVASNSTTSTKTKGKKKKSAALAPGLTSVFIIPAFLVCHIY